MRERLAQVCFYNLDHDSRRRACSSRRTSPT
jgi:hypothetical protein